LKINTLVVYQTIFPSASLNSSTQATNTLLILNLTNPKNYKFLSKRLKDLKNLKVFPLFPPKEINLSAWKILNNLAFPL